VSENKRSKSIKIGCLTALLVVAADRLTKAAAVYILTTGESLGILPGIFHITLVFNKGMAFGLLQNGTVFLIVGAVAAITMISWYALRARRHGVMYQVALGLILGGAAGNLIDRIRFGYVIDFLDFRIWPVFNLADSSITIGAIMIAWKIFLKKT